MNNLLLAILLKNFRWLKFDFSKLKQFINCPRCLIVRLNVIQFTRYSVRCTLASQLAYTSTFISICQELFSSFFKFLFLCSYFAPPCRTACIYYHVKRLLSTPYFRFFQFFPNQKRGLFRGPLGSCSVIRHRRSGHSRLLPCGRPLRRHRRYPHPGKRRNYGPADSSAAPPPPGSWA